ncbi:MAG: hypothetical protein LBF75_03815 [Treponema sp.]|jgi:hypothetical protein|nr:hypothetical protein [Treponema sp.]
MDRKEITVRAEDYITREKDPHFRAEVEELLAGGICGVKRRKPGFSLQSFGLSQKDFRCNPLRTQEFSRC